MATITPINRAKRTALVDVQEVKRALPFFFTFPGQVVEVRALEASFDQSTRYTRTIGGYFDNPDDLIEAICAIRRALGIYITLQQCHPDLLHRAENKLLEQKNDYSTPDKYITEYQWLAIDCDPDRVSAISSTDEEHEKSLAMCRKIRDALKVLGWTDPILADSGNGGHLLYRVGPDADASLFKRVLEGLQQFNEVDVHVDQTLYNPSRVIKLYGTLACKGDNTTKRPHRFSRIVEVPDETVTVTTEQLEAIASPIAQANEKASSTSKTRQKRQKGNEDFDSVAYIEDILRDHNIEHKPKQPWNGGWIWELKQCWSDPSHCDGDAYITVSANGEIGAGCHHDSCTGKKWESFKEYYGIETGKKKQATGQVDTTNIDQAIESKDAKAVMQASDILARLTRSEYAIYKQQIKDALGKNINLRDLDSAVCEQRDLLSGQGESEKEDTALARLMRIADQAHLICTPSSALYARVPINNHHEIVSIGEKGSGFRRWLVHRFKAEYGFAPNSDAISQTMSGVQADAEFIGESAEIYTRIAEKDGCIYLDLANDKWQCVEISNDGWRVITCPPVYFRRPSGLLPLPIPATEGSLDELRELINAKDDRDYKLITAWLVGTLHPKGPYPVLNLNGERGTAKTKTTTILRSIVDPSIAPTRNTPKDDREAAITAQNNMVIALDNLSSMPLWLSDLLCRIATGSGFSARELYTDDAERVFNNRRPIIMNGIEDGIISQGDLLNRTIMVTLAPPDKYRTEEDIDELFREKHSSILGALLTVASVALRDRKSVHLEEIPRMADFAKWVVASEPALGWKQGTFMDVYTENQDNASSIVMDSSPVAKAIVQFMNNRNFEWKGLIGDLLTELLKYEIFKDAKKAPKAANSLSGHLKRIAPVMRTQGIDIQHCEHTKKGRIISIKLINSDGPGDDSGDDTHQKDNEYRHQSEYRHPDRHHMDPDETPNETTNSQNGDDGDDGLPSITAFYPPEEKEKEEEKREKDSKNGRADREEKVSSPSSHSGIHSNITSEFLALGSRLGYPSLSWIGLEVGLGSWLNFSRTRRLQIPTVISHFEKVSV